MIRYMFKYIVFSSLILAASWENQRFVYAKTKATMSFAVTAKLITALVFATWYVQSLYFLNPRFQASNHLLWLSRLVCVLPSRNLRTFVFSRRGSIIIFCIHCCMSPSLLFLSLSFTVNSWNHVETVSLYHDYNFPEQALAT